MKTAEHISQDEKFMQRAFELASRGKGSVSPNPLVGAVIVSEGRIIGEGWHAHFGMPHAEANAVADVSEKNLLAGSTVYVTLEPCSHVGRNPPCADLLIRQKVKKVVISTGDPNPLVAGQGLEKLKGAGIEIVHGFLEDAGRFINRRFFTFIEKKRPYIILKWAETSDGFIARENFDSKWISNEYSRQLVHKWRAEEDAILVGKQTALADDPKLNVRSWTGKDPLRIVIDRNVELPTSLKVFDGSQKTVCYNQVRNETRENSEFVSLPSGNFLPAMLSDLFNRKVQSVIVEGGAKTLDAFIESGLWDEARVFVSPQLFGKGIAAPRMGEHQTVEDIRGDLLKTYFRGR